MELIRKKIYDPILRVIHLGVSLFCILLLISAYMAKYYYEEGAIRKAFWVVHVYAGFALISFLILRIIWGFLGTKYSRWSELIKLVEWSEAIRAKTTSVLKWNWGHHPLGAIAYIFFYMMLTFSSLSGIFLAAIEHNLGPLAKKYYDQLLFKEDLLLIHEIASYFIIIYIFSHLFALYWHEINDKIPITQSMFSGYQYRIKKEEKNEENQTIK
jgi:Ni/Fe-hydrogenase 1 B-type cytochrome subunit